MHKIAKNLSIYLLIVLVILVLLRFMSPDGADVENLNYSQFFSAVEQGQVQRVLVKTDNDTNLITGKFRDGRDFQTKGPANDPDL
ncbi:MAG: ATP-dependent metallopeptidase FtsH/Yme1/Tma family protein, partial [Eubacteriales bacterium]|nr:ATP-dependent metallopeptidase FtsH/Yme1/Tma family protein [Eubacteriales bacterium]